MHKQITAMACAAIFLCGCQWFKFINDEPQAADPAQAPHSHTSLTQTAATNAPNARAAHTSAVSPAVSAYMDQEEADLRSRLLAAGVSVNRQHDRIVLIMDSDVTFASNSDQVLPQFYQVLAAIGEVLTRYDRTKVDVSGHTDSAAAGDHGQVLTRRQAAAVAAVLKAHGVVQQRVHAEGLGKSRPIASNATSAGRAKNRRVEIQINPMTS